MQAMPWPESGSSAVTACAGLHARGATDLGPGRVVNIASIAGKHANAIALPTGRQGLA